MCPLDSGMDYTLFGLLVARLHTSGVMISVFEPTEPVLQFSPASRNSQMQNRTAMPLDPPVELYNGLDNMYNIWHNMS